MGEGLQRGAELPQQTHRTEAFMTQACPPDPWLPSPPAPAWGHRRLGGVIVDWFECPDFGGWDVCTMPGLTRTATVEG